MENTKEDFPIFTAHPDLVYLDNAASSQTPHSVIQRMTGYYEQSRANVHRGLYPTAVKTSQDYDDARGVLANFIGAKQDEVVFTSGATDSINKLLLMLEHSHSLKPNDEIITTVMEHHAVLVPLLELAKRRGCSIKYAPLSANLTIDEIAILNLITDRTRLVVMSMASNVLGTITNVSSVCKKAREVGALSIVDAAKAAGHIPINITLLDCDFLFFSGHKMCGPTGIGILYGKSELLAKLKPCFYGGGMVTSVNKNGATYQNVPGRFEAGTPPIAEAIGLSEAVRYLENIGVEDIHNHVRKLVEEASEALGSIEQVTIFSAPASQNAGVLSFSVKGIHPHDVAELLGRENVAVRAGHHCAEPLMNELGVKSLTRASFYLYNTHADIRRLHNAIMKAVSIFS